MHQLRIITSTTRPSRKGPAVAAWVLEEARKRPEFHTELLDIAVINLPLMDEPNHPRLQQYTKDHTKQWSRMISEADAFIIVLGEYNYSYPAPIKNALDYLVHEWKYKPVGLVSYGGVAAGTRSSQQLKQVITAFNMMPLSEQVEIPFFTKHINEQGVFVPDDHNIHAAATLFKELIKWTEAMKQLREKP